MTDTKELDSLISRICHIGGVVRLNYDPEGNISSVQISDVKGIGPYAMAPIAAAESMRKVLWMRGTEEKNTVLKLSNGYVIEYSNNIPYLYRNGNHVVCTPILLKEIVDMRTLLQQVSDSKYEENPVEALHKALDKVDQYVLRSGHKG